MFENQRGLTCHSCPWVPNFRHVWTMNDVCTSHWGKITLFVQNFTWFWYLNNCELCEKVWFLTCEFSWKMRFSTCEFLDSLWFFAPVWRLKSSPWILTMWKYIKVKPLKILKIIISSFPLSGLVFGWPEHFSSTAFNIGEFWMAWPRVTFAVIESALLTVKGSLLLCRLLVVGICTLTQTTPWE